MDEMNRKAFEIVREAVAELAEEVGFDQLREPSAEALLFGGEDGIDSLSLVRLVADVERLAERKFGKRIVLADDRAMSRRSSPFRTVGTLSELLQERLGEANA